MMANPHAWTLAVGLALVARPVAAEPPAAPCPSPPACPACPACPSAPARAAPRRWSGTLGLSLVSVTGNARSFTGALNAAAEYELEDWILGGKAAGTYGESRNQDTGANEVSAEAAALFLRADRRLTPRLSVYVLAGVETDHPKSIEARYSQEAGAGYAWIDEARGDEKLLLRTDLGLRIGEEYRFQYFPAPARVDPREFTLKSPHASAALRWEPNRLVALSQDLGVLPNLGEARWLVNSVSKVSARLLGPFALGVSYTVSYDSAPPAPKIPWDTLLAITLEYGL